MSTEFTDRTQRLTTRGTPCAQSWTDDWIGRVEAREAELDRRICGARTIGGRPCPQPADHPSGRCRHHGGFPLTGAPAGNRNAVIHGLYSRRLALAGDEPDGLGGTGTMALRPDRPAPAKGSAPGESPSTPQQNADTTRLRRLDTLDRAVCPFEQAEYNAVVTDMMQRTCANPNNACGLHLAHQIALLTVMVSRAARALAHTTLTQKTEQSAENYHMSVDKPSAALIAFEKLSAELRRWMQLIEKNYPAAAEVATETAVECEMRREYDTRTDPDGLAAIDAARAIVDEHFAAPRAQERATADVRQAVSREKAARAVQWDIEDYRKRTGTDPGARPAWDVFKKIRAHATNGHAPG